MGLFIRTRRIPEVGPEEAFRRRVMEALLLLEPFVGDSVGGRAAVYRFVPIRLEGEPFWEERFEFEGENDRMSIVRGAVERVVGEAYRGLGTLYTTVVVVELYYKPEGFEAPIVLYLMVNNGGAPIPDIELEVLPWMRDEETVFTLEETLDIVGVGRHVLHDLASTLSKRLVKAGYSVVGTGLGESPEVLLEAASFYVTL